MHSFFMNPKILRDFYKLWKFTTLMISAMFLYIYSGNESSKPKKFPFPFFEYVFFKNNLNQQICVGHGPQSLTSCAILTCQGCRAWNYFTIYHLLFNIIKGFTVIEPKIQLKMQLYITTWVHFEYDMNLKNHKICFK